MLGIKAKDQHKIIQKISDQSKLPCRLIFVKNILTWNKLFDFRSFRKTKILGLEIFVGFDLIRKQNQRAESETTTTSEKLAHFYSKNIYVYCSILVTIRYPRKKKTIWKFLGQKDWLSYESLKSNNDNSTQIWWKYLGPNLFPNIFLKKEKRRIQNVEEQKCIHLTSFGLIVSKAASKLLG